MILKKVSLSIASIMVVASVAACSSGNVPSSVGINGGADFKGSNLNQVQFNKLVQNLNSQGEKPTIIDMGHKGGVSFAVKINPATTGSSFSTKDNLQGHKFVAADIDKVKVFLFAASSFNANDTLTPASGSEFTINKTATSGTFNVVFTNVPGNANPWRVAVASLTTQTAALNGNPSPRNITKAVGEYGKIGSEIYAVSSTGGDDSTATVGSGNGSLLINVTTLKFTNFDSLTSISTTPLGIATTLIDADTPIIDSKTTITDGDTTIGAIQVN